MLDPFFFQSPADFTDISENDELYFRVLGYSQHQNYTLVTWGYGDSEEIVTGQSLYRDRDLVTNSGGALFDRQSSTQGQASDPDYQQLLAQSTEGDGYGVPRHVADRLLDPANYYNFTGGTV